MRDYEMILVLHPGLSTPDAEAIVERTKARIGDHGGSVQHEEHMGMKELAYPIERQTTGDYHMYQFQADNSAVADIDRDLRLDDKVLRHLIVVDEKWAERNREATAKRKAVAGEDSDG